MTVPENRFRFEGFTRLFGYCTMTHHRKWPMPKVEGGEISVREEDHWYVYSVTTYGLIDRHGSYECAAQGVGL